jgi:hypothetical protein
VFTSATPPHDVLAEAYATRARHVASGELVIDVEAIPLDRASQAWEAQRARAGRPRRGIAP